MRESRRDSRFDEGVQRVERELGAQFPGRRRGAGARAHGTIGDATLAITADAFGDPAAERYTELIVAMEGPRIPRVMSFAREGGDGQDVLTGDPYFDDTVAIHGEPHVVLALLDKDLRQ